MKKNAWLMIGVVIALAVSGCSSAQMSSYLSPVPATYLNAVERTEANTLGAQDCPSWSDLPGYCLTHSQSLYGGSLTDPSPIEIKKLEAGSVQLNQTIITKTWGLIWFDENGEQIDITKVLVDGTYFYRKVSVPAGFWLVKK